MTFDDVRFLTLDEVAYINDRLTRDTLVREHLAGLHNVRDPELLASAVGQPQATAFGDDAYPTLAEKAAVLLYGIARNHPFADGNVSRGFPCKPAYLKSNSS